LHHHAQPVGGIMDTMMLENAAQFLTTIAPFNQVKAVLCGHVHQEFSTIKNNIHYLATPSTCFQVMPKQMKFLRDSLTAGYRWLQLQDDGTIQTNIVRIKE
jgi:Icc protein